MKAKFIYVLIAVILLSMLLSGCNNILESLFGADSDPVPFTFRQERSAVKKVMICTYKDGLYTGPIAPILQLSEAQIDDFYNEMLKLDVCKFSKLDPPTGYGDLIFLVSYHDGENEIISFVNLGFITSDGYMTERHEHIDQRGLSKVFVQFASPDELSKVSGKFRHWYSTRNE